MTNKNYAGDLVEELYRKYDSQSEDYSTTISLRLDPKNGMMLKGLAALFGFSATGVFTDIISKHLLDMLLSLTPEEFEHISQKAEESIGVRRHNGLEDALATLKKAGGYRSPPCTLSKLLAELESEDTANNA